VVTVFDQAGFDARLEWGIAGARVLAGASGRELAALGRVAEVRLAAEHDVSRVVPVLRDGAFTAA
jgi:phosphosulfolactate phosphohydrolase-like enzyme